MASIMRGKLGYFLTNFSSNFASRASNFHKNQKVLLHYSSILFGQGQELKMPSLSPTMTEGKIVKWLKKEGDTINPGDVLCDIETDKAIVSMEVEEEGVLAKILVAENTPNIKVGSLIGLMVSQGEDWKSVDVPDKVETSISDSSLTSSSTSSEPVIGGPSSIPIKMPSLSPTMTSGTIVQWLKKEGDTVAVGDVLCEIQTDKAVMSMEAEEDGILAKIIVPNDSKDVSVGTLIAVIVPEGEDWKSVTVSLSPPVEIKKDQGKPSVASGAAGSKEVRLKTFGPAVKALLECYQLEPELIKPTGRNNRILKEDVLQFIAENNLNKKPPKIISEPAKVTKSGKDKQDSATPLKSKTTSTPISKYKDIELSQVRQVRARKLVESKQNIPHSYSLAKCDVDNLLKTKEVLFLDGIKVTLNDLLTKATALALQLHPKANSIFVNNEVKLSENVDINVDIPTDVGLYSPVIRFTNHKSVVAISQEIEDLSVKAKSGLLQSEESQGGTFTISNLGDHGITHCRAIVNPPQCGILAVGGIQETLNSDLNSVKQIILSLSYDRRTLQEHEAAKFMETLKYFIENPKVIVLDINHGVNKDL